MRSLQGATSHVGRLGEVKSQNDIKTNLDDRNEENTEKKELNKIEKLKDDLKQAIKDERYEDAAKLRDEIKSIEDGQEE